MWKGSEQSPKGEYVLNLNNPANGLTCKIRCVILDTYTNAYEKNVNWVICSNIM